MSIYKVVRSDLPTNMANVVEEELCSEFQFIRDASIRSLAAITGTLYAPEIAATSQQLFIELKQQQQSLVANISESLSLIDEIWLLWQTHFERQFAAVGHVVDQREPAKRPTTAVDH